jgi:hypothetical protein
MNGVVYMGSLTWKGTQSLKNNSSGSPQERQQIESLLCVFSINSLCKSLDPQGKNPINHGGLPLCILDYTYLNDESSNLQLHFHILSLRTFFLSNTLVCHLREDNKLNHSCVSPKRRQQSKSLFWLTPKKTTQIITSLSHPGEDD